MERNQEEDIQRVQQKHIPKKLRHPLKCPQQRRCQQEESYQEPQTLNQNSQNKIMNYAPAGDCSSGDTQSYSCVQDAHHLDNNVNVYESQSMMQKFQNSQLKLKSNIQDFQSEFQSKAMHTKPVSQPLLVQQMQPTRKGVIRKQSETKEQFEAAQPSQQIQPEDKLRSLPQNVQLSLEGQNSGQQIGKQHEQQEQVNKESSTDDYQVPKRRRAPKACYTCRRSRVKCCMKKGLFSCENCINDKILCRMPANGDDGKGYEAYLAAIERREVADVTDNSRFVSWPNFVEISLMNSDSSTPRNDTKNAKFEREIEVFQKYNNKTTNNVTTCTVNKTTRSKSPENPNIRDQFLPEEKDLISNIVFPTEIEDIHMNSNDRISSSENNFYQHKNDLIQICNINGIKNQYLNPITSTDANQDTSLICGLPDKRKSNTISKKKSSYFNSSGKDIQSNDMNYSTPALDFAYADDPERNYMWEEYRQNLNDSYMTAISEKQDHENFSDDQNELLASGVSVPQSDSSQENDRNKKSTKKRINFKGKKANNTSNTQNSSNFTEKSPSTDLTSLDHAELNLRKRRKKQCDREGNRFARISHADIISYEVISVKEARQFVSYFFTEFVPFFCVHIPQAFDSLTKIINEPSLMAVVCMIGSRCRNGPQNEILHTNLWNYGKMIMCSMLWNCNKKKNIRSCYCSITFFIMVPGNILPI